MTVWQQKLPSRPEVIRRLLACLVPVILLAIPASPPLSSRLPPRLFQVKILADSEVRLKIVGVRVDATEIVSGAVCMRRMPCARAFILSGSTVSTSEKKFIYL